MSGDRSPLVVIATIMNPEGPTGVQTHFNTLRRYLLDTGRRSQLVTPFDAPKALVFPVFALRKIIDVISRPASVWWYRQWHQVFLKWALKRVLAKHPHSVVYAQCPVSAKAAQQARRDPAQPIVMVVHFNSSQADEWCEKGALTSDGLIARNIRTLEAQVLPRLDAIVYVSRYIKNRLENRHPALTNVPSTVIPNFCDSAPALRMLPSVDIINVGTLEPRKNQTFLLHVIAYTKRKGRRYTLALVGDGPDRARLERLARELAVDQQVRFLGNRPHAIELMGSARIYAHSAIIENLPLALIEALACGLPILAPATGGIPDLYEEGDAGFYWNVDDVDSAAELLMRVLDDRGALKIMSKAARLRFAGRFETSGVASRLQSFLDQRADEASPKKPFGTRAA